MARALKLAQQGLGRTSPNPLVGAVLVREDRLIGQGAHLKFGSPHAEVAAIVNAGGQCEGATLYVNLEPCSHHGKTPPCAEALIRHGVRRVVAAVEDPNPLVQGKGFAMLREAGVQVDVGLMETAARQLNEIFFTYHTLKRPFVTVKWAMTLDGRTSTDTGGSQWITNRSSRHYVHELRGLHDAILVGVGTVIIDNPRLNVRLKSFRGRQPARILVDAVLRTPLNARCLDRRGGTRTFLAANRAAPPERIERFESAGHRVLLVEGQRRRVSMRELMARLYEEGLTSVFVEGGRQIVTALFREQVVDRLVTFIAPRIIGGRQVTSPIEDLDLTRMDDALQLERVRVHTFENDVCFEGYIRARNKNARMTHPANGESSPGSGAP